MKFRELKNKPDQELQKFLSDWRDKLHDLRFKTASNQLKNIREIRETKKTIARVLYLLNQRKKGIKKEAK